MIGTVHPYLRAVSDKQIFSALSHSYTPKLPVGLMCRMDSAEYTRQDVLTVLFSFIWSVLMLQELYFAG